MSIKELRSSEKRWKRGFANGAGELLLFTNCLQTDGIFFLASICEL